MNTNHDINAADTKLHKLQPIAGASRYGVSPLTGHVYHLKKGRRIKKHWSPKGYYGIVTDDRGRRVRVYVTAETPRTRPDVDPLARERVRPIPDYPDYVQTPYGAVWRISGGRLRRPLLVAEHARGNVAYVQLRDRYGRRHNRRVLPLLQQVWGDAADPLLV